MYDSGTVGHGYVAVADYIEALLALALRLFAGAGKEGLILLILQILSYIFLQDLIGRLSFFPKAAQHLVKQGLGHIIGIAVRRLHLHISVLRVHAEAHVGGQGPGRGGPCQEISVLALYLKADDRRALLHRLVALGYLMAGQGRPAAGAVRHDLKALVEQALFPDFL